MDLFDVAASNLPGEDTLPGVRPDIGVEQSTSGLPHGPDLGNPGQRGDDGLDPSDLEIGKTAAPPRRPGRQMNGAVGEEERGRQVVGHTFGAPFQQDRKIQRTRRVRQAAADRLAGRNYAGDRTVAKVRCVE